MPNSDTQDGLHNKITKEFRYHSTTDDSVQTQDFGGNLETAKAFFLSADHLANNDTNSTQIEYAITADGNGLKYTIAFGTKGTAGIAEGDDWTGIWATNVDTMKAADTIFNARTYVVTNSDGEESTHNLCCRATDATPHLF